MSAFWRITLFARKGWESTVGIIIRQFHKTEFSGGWGGGGYPTPRLTVNCYIYSFILIIFLIIIVFYIEVFCKCIIVFFSSQHVVLGCLDQTAKTNVAATVEELNPAIIWQELVMKVALKDGGGLNAIQVHIYNVFNNSIYKYMKMNLKTHQWFLITFLMNKMHYMKKQLWLWESKNDLNFNFSNVIKISLHASFQIIHNVLVEFKWTRATAEKLRVIWLVHVQSIFRKWLSSLRL